MSNSNSNSIATEYCKKNVLDMVPLEVQVVNAYLDQKMATLRAVIAAGNALSYALGVDGNKLFCLENVLPKES